LGGVAKKHLLLREKTNGCISLKKEGRSKKEEDENPTRFAPKSKGRRDEREEEKSLKKRKKTKNRQSLHRRRRPLARNNLREKS